MSSCICAYKARQVTNARFSNNWLTLPEAATVSLLATYPNDIPTDFIKTGKDQMFAAMIFLAEAKQSPTKSRHSITGKITQVKIHPF